MASHIITSTTSWPRMCKELLEAASCGNWILMQPLASENLLGKTQRENNCLHISCSFGHKEFCEKVLLREKSLLQDVNLDGETPLVIAVSRAHASLASFILGRCKELGLSQTILQRDIDGCNALHHAIRGGHDVLARRLLAQEPALSQHVNKHKESPMFMAVMRNWEYVSKKLLDIPDSAHAGPGGYNALHAAVRNGNPAIASKILEKRPGLARETSNGGTTPTRLAVLYQKTEVLRVLLEHDASLGYEGSKEGVSLLYSAASRGHVDVAQVLLEHCPDAPSRNVSGVTCLHGAVFEGHTPFVEFILNTPQLQHLVNARDNEGRTALHQAVKMCDPKIVAVLLSHKSTDATVTDNEASPAAYELGKGDTSPKTLNWNEVRRLMSKADHLYATALSNLHEELKKKTTKESREDAKSLTQTYISNTSLVAILMATITFAAAFTLPGGYSSAAGSEGLPVMSRKFAFQAFLISNTLAMCSSFLVAFICIIARWEDYEFLVYYRSCTKKLMWFAYIATTVAFSTGLYTVLAPDLHWLAIGICSLVALLPVLTKLLGQWPVLKLRFLLGNFKSDLIDMI